MSADSWLWDLVHDLFESDDGSLPEIRVHYCGATAVVAGYERLRRYVVEAGGSEGGTIELKGGVTSELNSVERPAALVASGAAEPFHALLRLSLHGTRLPPLGVFVLPDQIAIDYRMGAEWGPAEVDALFGLIEELRSQDPRSTVSLEEGVPVKTARRFQNAWGRYSHQHAAQQAAAADRGLG